VQILGAEKALFRALKTKRDTPKYGLIYHAQIIGQAAAKFKGKVSDYRIPHMCVLFDCA
jgi:nucleolar protein 58